MHFAAPEIETLIPRKKTMTTCTTREGLTSPKKASSEASERITSTQCGGTSESNIDCDIKFQQCSEAISRHTRRITSSHAAAAAVDTAAAAASGGTFTHQTSSDNESDTTNFETIRTAQHKTAQGSQGTAHNHSSSHFVSTLLSNHNNTGSECVQMTAAGLLPAVMSGQDPARETPSPESHAQTDTRDPDNPKTGQLIPKQLKK